MHSFYWNYQNSQLGSKFSNIQIPKSAYKWTSSSSAKIPNANLRKSISTPNFANSYWKSTNGPIFTTSNYENQKFVTNNQGYSAGNQFRKMNPVSTNFHSKIVVNPKIDRIFYDPKKRTLMKTINTGFSPAPIPANSRVKEKISCPIPKKSSMVSQFKLVRNTAHSKSAKLSSVQKSSPKFRVTKKMVSKYRIRRRSFSSSGGISKNHRWSNGFNGKRLTGGNRRDMINRFKIVRTDQMVRSKKNLYKIDRRSESKLRISKASHVLNRSRRILSKHQRVKINRNIQHAQSTRYCLFYTRYGRCCRGNSCPFIHDPTKVAVCTRYLRGTCQIQECPFSHVVSPDKMPLCRHYLLGVCSRSECPYLHVKHAKSAENCKDFERGFCPKGAKCDKKHVAISQGSNKKTKPMEMDPKKTADSMENGKKLFSNKLRAIMPCEKSDNIDPLQGPLPDFISLSKYTDD